jgi:hypothetical protein
MLRMRPRRYRHLVTDEQDQPEEEGMTLAVPFTLVTSVGGPYDDEAFCAGFQCGEVDRALDMGAAARAETVRFPQARSALLPQLELIAMNRGYPIMEAKVSDEWPEWCDVTFARGDGGP